VVGKELSELMPMLELNISFSFSKSILEAQMCILYSNSGGSYFEHLMCSGYFVFVLLTTKTLAISYWLN